MRPIDFGTYETTSRTVWRRKRDTFEPSYVLGDDIKNDLKEVDRLEHEIGYLRTDRNLTRKVSEITLEEAVFGTLRLSGIEVTLDEVRSTVARRPAYRAPIARREREMLNLAAAIDAIPDRVFPTDLQELCNEHVRMFQDVDPDAGEPRDRATFEPDGVSDEVGFVPTMPDDIAHETRALLDWVNRSKEPPIVRAAIFIHELSAIQPFLNGSARLARSLANVLLYQSGCAAIGPVLLEPGLWRTRDEAAKMFLDAERQRDLTPWIRYVVQVSRGMYDDGKRRFLLHQRADGNLNERQWRVAEWFSRRSRGRPDERLRFSEIHAAFPDIPERTLQRDLATLRENGILEMEGKWKGARYVFVPLDRSGSSRA